jgi:hypothetical protein
LVSRCPLSPSLVAYAAGIAVMNGWASAARAASTTSAAVAARPALMLSAIVPSPGPHERHGQGRSVRVADRAATEPDVAVRGLLQPRQHPQQVGLACPV